MFYQGKICIRQQKVIQFQFVQFLFLPRWRHFLKWFFLLQLWQTFPLAGHLPQWWEFSQDLHFLIISLALVDIWLLDFECFEILCRSMVSFVFRISQACLWVSSAASPADIALGRGNSDSWRCFLKKFTDSFKFTFWTKFFSVLWWSQESFTPHVADM